MVVEAEAEAEAEAEEAEEEGGWEVGEVQSMMPRSLRSFKAPAIIFIVL